MKITKIDRGSIEIEINNEILILQGEAMMPQPAPKLSDYVIYLNSIAWKIPEKTTEINTKRILKFIEQEFLKKRMRLIIE